MPADLEQLEVTLGHSFSDRSLLVRALTHRSQVNEKLAGGAQSLGDNEQLEFLGDAILGFLVSVELVKRHPSSHEGRLSKLKAHVVSADHLHVVARELGLGEYLQLGRGEEMSGGREKKALLANAVEAIIAALFVDGGIDAAGGFVERCVLGEFDPERDAAGGIVDFKSALQEMAQTLRLPSPRYSIVKQDGPEHAKSFTVEVSVGKQWVGRAQGPSKKSAGQKAAQAVFDRLSEMQGAAAAGGPEPAGSPEETDSGS
jgi:ribonuclease-3